jgi:methylenetetrahydrofolate reductase (NADPH)
MVRGHRMSPRDPEDAASASRASRPDETAGAAGQPRDAILRRLFEETPGLPLSFELFPPPTEQARHRLEETVDRLAGVASDGFSVTMGAGGSARTRSAWRWPAAADGR